MTKFTFTLVQKIAPRGKYKITKDLAELLNKHLPKYGINNPKRITLFLANILTETGGFRALEENLNYSAKRIRQVWPSRFSSVAKAIPFAHNPERLANIVYNRYGNVGHKGWGWKYRGRGFMQTTFVDNYQKVKDVTGIDVVSNPDLLKDVEMALIAACIYWKQSGCNALADAGKIRECRKKVNGGYHGLSTVNSYYRKVLPLVADIKLDKDVEGVAGGAVVTTVGVGVAQPTFLLPIIVFGLVALVGVIVYKKRKRKKDVQQALGFIEGMEDIPD